MADTDSTEKRRFYAKTNMSFSDSDQGKYTVVTLILRRLLSSQNNCVDPTTMLIQSVNEKSAQRDANTARARWL